MTLIGVFGFHPNERIHVKGPLTNLSQFKRALTVGSRWETRNSAILASLDHPRPTAPTLSRWAEKEVVHVQTNAVAFSIHLTENAITAGRANPRRAASWLWFEKASRYAFEGDVVRIQHGDPHHWREYRLKKPQ